MHTSAASITKIADITSFLRVPLNNIKAPAAPADTMTVWPEGKPYSLSAEIKKSDVGITGLGLATISFANSPSGTRTSIDIAMITAVFLPVQPPKINKRIIAIGQNISLPYLVSEIIILLNAGLCELLIFKKAEESALLIGELLLIALLKPTFGEISMAINMNKARVTIEAPKYLFN